MRNHLNTHCTTLTPLIQEVFKDILEYTLMRDYLNTHCATLTPLIQEVMKDILEYTLMRDYLNVHCAIGPSVPLAIYSYT